MLVALGPGRRGADRDEVVERQTPGLEPGTAESEGLGVGWGRAAAQMQAAWGGNGGGRGGSTEMVSFMAVTSRGILNTSLRAPCVPSQCVGGRLRISRQEMLVTLGGKTKAVQREKRVFHLQRRGRPLAPLCAPGALSFQVASPGAPPAPRHPLTAVGLT